MAATVMEGLPAAPDMGQNIDSAFADIVADLQPQIVETSPLAANLSHLQSLRENGQVTGFDDSQWELSSTHLLASGYPLGSIDRITQRTNTKDTHDVLAQWHFGYRELSLFDLHYDLHEHGEHGHAGSLGTTVHELAHVASPFREENNEIYGGEENRVEAGKYIASVAEQTIFTGVHLNGYHQTLLQEYTSAKDNLAAARQSGQISENEYMYQMGVTRYTFYEETGAILHQMATVDRGGLEVAEEYQHRAWEDKARIKLKAGQAVPVKVPLMTHAEMPGAEADGIDRHILNVLPEVTSFDALVEHIKDLKKQFYPHDKRSIAETRAIRREALYRYHVAISHLGFSTVLLAGAEPDIAAIYREADDDDDETFRLSGLDKSTKN